MFSSSKGSIWFMFLIFGGPLILSFQNCGKGFQTSALPVPEFDSNFSSIESVEEPVEPFSVEDEFYKISTMGAERGSDIVIQIEKLGVNKSGFIQVYTQDLSAKAGIDFTYYAATLTFEEMTNVNLETNENITGKDTKKLVLVLAYTNELGETKNLLKTIEIRPISMLVGGDGQN